MISKSNDLLIDLFMLSHAGKGKTNPGSQNITREEKEKYFERFFNLSVDLIAIANMEGYFTMVSDSFVSTLGYSRKELLSRPIADFVHPEDRKKTEVEIEHLSKGSQTHKFEIRYQSSDGSVKWLSWKSVAVEEDGLIYAIARDITAQKENEIKLQEYSVQLAQFKKDLTDSLNYAYIVQRAIFPDPETLNYFIPDSFVLLQPKDQVSGDFFWFDKCKGKTIVVAGDCTGHGVPAALLSIMGVNFIHNIFNIEHIDDPELLIKQLDEMVYNGLGKKFGRKMMFDGMDISVLVHDEQTNTVSVCGVNNPVYLIRDGELITLAPNKHYLGNQVKESDFSFTHMEVKPDDKFYLFSDGYADQFGGAKGKKMGYKNFRNFLLSISHLPMDQQHLQLILKFEEWKGDIEQTDDMLLIGLNFK